MKGAGLDRRADRDEHAPRHAADPRRCSSSASSRRCRPDVECTHDGATSSRRCARAMTMQRMVVNQMILEQGSFSPLNQWPPPAPGTPPLLNVARRAALRHHQRRKAPASSTARSARSSPARRPTSSSSTPRTLNVAPLNHVPGAVVSLMERRNVETVIVAGKVRKWKGQAARRRPQPAAQPA